MKERSLGLLFTTIGIALAIFIVFFKASRPSSGSLVPVVLIIGPWLVAAALLIFVPRLRGVSAGSLLMLIYECLLYYQVFASESSTASMDYMFKWVIQLVILLPVGTAIGGLIMRRREQGSGTKREQ